MKKPENVFPEKTADCESPKGGLIPRLGPRISSHLFGFGKGKTLNLIRALRHTNRYKDHDFSRPQIVQIEVPITGGWLPAWHTQTTAFLPQEMWDELPDVEKVKWRSSPYERDGQSTRIFFRTYSTSLGKPDQSRGDSIEGDYLVANTLLGRQDAILRPVWSYIRETPAPVTRYKIDERTGKIVTYADADRDHPFVIGKTDAEYWDCINALAPTKMAVLETYDDRMGDDGSPVPIWQTINEAMNQGVAIAEMAALGDGYWLPTNNCHYGTIVANAWNPYLKPGMFSSGRFAGYRADTSDSPDSLYRNRLNPFRRTYQRFSVRQREPAADETPTNRKNRLEDYRNRALKGKTGG